MKTLLLDDNLMSQTRVEAGLKSAGMQVTTRSKWPDDADFALVVINLGSRSLAGLRLLEEANVRVPGAKIWAFCGHLEVEIRRAALQIGVDKLLTNEGAMSEIGAAVRAEFGSAARE
jgi:DNA-binding NarL/FixJ family response regulator